jgi:hypothetical protein
MPQIGAARSRRQELRPSAIITPIGLLVVRIR